MKRIILFLVGPTGSGKTELALCLAKRLRCEIVSADSMLVYRGMDIGTAKPTLADRRRIPHHLIDITSPRANLSVYDYRKKALEAIRRIARHGRLPLVVGGSGLYVDVLRKGISAPRGGNLKLRQSLSRFARKNGSAFLHERLKKLDPERAAQIHPNDERRIIRALEIAELSGKPSSDWQGRRDPLEELGYSVRVYGIERPREELYERINRRVIRMFQKGFLQEVKRLRKKGFSRTARQALGYKEVLSVTRPRNDEKVLIPLIQKHTRHFAKRQFTWFRRDKEIRWIPWPEGEPVSRICGKIVRDAKTWLGKERF